MICNMTIWSPVYTKVYLNNKGCLLMIIDPNSGFDYSNNSPGVNKRFKLIFEAKGFSKSARFTTPEDGDFEWRLKDTLTPEEIEGSYDRDEALNRLKNKKPSGYTFMELEAVGISEDIPLIMNFILSSKKNLNSTAQYLTATACSALSAIAKRENDPQGIANVSHFLKNLYEEYTAKQSYGWMIESAMKSLL